MMTISYDAKCINDTARTVAEAVRSAPEGTDHTTLAASLGYHPGDTVQIRRGCVGSGYRFRVEGFYIDRYLLDIQVYGNNYGPVRMSDIERLRGV